jgi:hypothetical protein
MQANSKLRSNTKGQLELRQQEKEKSYTHDELKADSALRARVLAERKSVWDQGAVKPKVPRTGNSDRNKPKSEEQIS